MQGISIFQQIYAPRVAHVVTDFDGISHNTHSPYAMGGVVGSTGKMTAIVANDQADTWHIVNLKCGNLFDAVAVLGAFDESEAANMAMRYHGQYFDAVCGDVCESNTGGLQRFLNHPVYMRTNRPVYAEELAKLQDIPSTQAILWDGVQLKSHNGSSKHLLLDMMRCDDDKALLEKMDFVEEESQLDGEIAEYDALVVEAYKLESTVSKLALAMDKATSISTLKVAKQTLSKPKTMRGFGVIQQLVSFELSDGQAVSIIFNVSDSEANASAKMTKDDLLVAWKYKLNSRDITAAVQPNATQNVSLNMIASRIMGLADANSEKFVAAQKKKDAMQTELANTNQQVKDLQGQEQALLQEIADLQKQLDEKAKNAEKEAKSRAEIEGMGKVVQSAPQDRPTDTQVAPVAQPNNTLQKDVSKSELFKDANVWAIDDFGAENGMVIYSRDEEDGFSIGVIDKLQQVNMQYTDIDSLEQINESFSTKNLTTEQVIEKISTFIEKHEQNSVNVQPVQQQSSEPEEIGEADSQSVSDKLMLRKALETRALGDSKKQKVFAFYYDDTDFVLQEERNKWVLMVRATRMTTEVKKPYGEEVVRSDNSKIFDTKAEAETWAIENGYIVLNAEIAYKKDGTQFVKVSETQPQATKDSPDRDYLQSIIDGDVDLSNADEIEAKLTDINERLDADLEPLFEQAAEVFAQYSIAQAATN